MAIVYVIAVTSLLLALLGVVLYKAAHPAQEDDYLAQQAKEQLPYISPAVTAQTEEASSDEPEEESNAEVRSENETVFREASTEVKSEASATSFLPVVVRRLKQRHKVLLVLVCVWLFTVFVLAVVGTSIPYKSVPDRPTKPVAKRHLTAKAKKAYTQKLHQYKRELRSYREELRARRHHKLAVWQIVFFGVLLLALLGWAGDRQLREVKTTQIRE